MNCQAEWEDQKPGSSRLQDWVSLLGCQRHQYVDLGVVRPVGVQLGTQGPEDVPLGVVRPEGVHLGTPSSEDVDLGVLRPDEDGDEDPRLSPELGSWLQHMAALKPAEPATRWSQGQKMEDTCPVGKRVFEL